MIRLATEGDLDCIFPIFKRAREYMQKEGNITQWGENYPAKSLLLSDIEKNQLFVYTENNTIEGVFVLQSGDDPAYTYIENGSFKYSAPYKTIHRIAASGRVAGVFAKCLAYCKENASYLRIDTHADNKTMRHLIEKHGFSQSGIVYMADKSPRIVYELEVGQGLCSCR